MNMQKYAKWKHLHVFLPTMLLQNNSIVDSGNGFIE